MIYFTESSQHVKVCLVKLKNEEDLIQSFCLLGFHGKIKIVSHYVIIEKIQVAETDFSCKISSVMLGGKNQVGSG